MQTGNRKAVIAGAGIGGLCTAIALQRQGWHVVIGDKREELAQLGAGIVLSANAWKVLQHLGVAEAVLQSGSKVGKAEIRAWDGRLIVDLPTDLQEKRYGHASCLIHRAALQNILCDRLIHSNQGGVQFNKKLIAYEQNEAAVTVMYEDGTEERADILIGADGVNSTVRELMFGSENRNYSGFTALRGIASYSDSRYTMEKGGGFEAWGSGKRFGFSHLGQGQVFWFAAINSPEGEAERTTNRKAAALRHFQGWYNPIEAVIAATDSAAILAHDIYDRKPLRRWSDGRVVLLGDAAHPMLPNLGQGGAQAMEDAVILVNCLRDSSVAAGIRSYEQLRIPRTSRVVRKSRRMGRVVQMENAAAIYIRNLLLRLMPASLQVAQFDWLNGYDAVARK